MELYATLEKYFKFKEFKPLQKKLILKILEHKDILAVLPTGYGKSLIYQISGLMLEGTTLVITPLISLMKDQVDNLTKKGIKACYINSLLDKTIITNIYNNIEDYSFIYVSPERLNNPTFKEKIKNIRLIVIDEAHTLLWGIEFRKAMLEISSFIASLSKRPVVAAFTATANYQTIKFIIKALQLEKPYIENRLPFNKNNEIICLEGDNQKILSKLLKKSSLGKTIIYALTREGVMNIYNKYKDTYSITFYHGGLDRKDKLKNQEEFTSSRAKIIVATIAFGMGIDISDIKTIILYDLPLTLGDLVQEIGRAGRDGSKTKSILILSNSSLKFADSLIQKSENKINALKEFDEVISFFYAKNKFKYLYNYFKKH